MKDSVYLGSSINTDNNISLEIRRRIIFANRCYSGLRKQLSKRVLSWRTKLCLYKSLILSVLLYGAEIWTITSSDEHALGVFDRKILRKIYVPFCDRGEWKLIIKKLYTFIAQFILKSKCQQMHFNHTSFSANSL